MAGGRCVVSGATGLVGSRLAARLLDDGAAVTALSRNPQRQTRALDPRADARRWDGTTPPAEQLEGASAVVHLAGEPIFGGAPTRARRARILASRVDSTRALVSALATLPEARRPATLVCASAVGVYAAGGDDELGEDAPVGRGFLAEVCTAWEAAAAAAANHGVRVVSLRIGIVLARGGGALPLLALPFRFGLGGRLGDGRQWVPWIDVDDLVALAAAALRDERFAGAVNAVAPHPVRNAELTRTVASVLRRPAWLPVPAFAVRAALGDLAGELLDSRRVVPRRAAELGFAFRRPELADALRAALGSR